MAGDPPRRRRDGALGVVGAVTIGAVTATFVAPAALADDPQYPTWNDVQRAKADRAAAEAEGARITGLLGTLQAKADAAGRTAAIAAERFHRAKLAEDSARDRHAALAQQADAAGARARTSRMRAGLLAASVARGSAGGLQLMLDASGADDFLQRLATVTQLSAQSQQITRQALTDQNEAAALGAQADSAATELADRAAAAQEALAAAQAAASEAGRAVEAEQQHADRLVAQLAELRGTSTRVAAQYAAGVIARQEAAEPAPSSGGGSSGAPAQGGGGAASAGGGTPSSGSSSGGSSSGSGAAGGVPSGGSSGGGSSAPSDPAPSAPSAPSPVEPSRPPVQPPSAGPPNSAQAASAVAYARDQIGDAYVFGGAGPNGWDCSGLTIRAYGSVGIGIGGHSATAQYDLARAQGQLVPYSRVQVGDLIFYTDGGGDMYHVAVYSGSGMMIEAPYPGVKVREVPVRSYQRVGQVARPTASAS
ncbi:C40 family peptidase [Amnibacterium setariae]|uniref:NlpC/P60 family protein n=1 Tax=Amnibacterium setariae TaxID=2306585 RepID=A0A3A1U193_9MICO|nr:C40 family peptidase [Amnibacterium setariae]RIX30232.1 NlpC/P60 family protein [Amnibacterium setariae]